jgi:hypothetical protein
MGPTDLTTGTSAYEERITLGRASSADEAIARAELEANEYAATLGNLYVDFHRPTTSVTFPPTVPRSSPLSATAASRPMPISITSSTLEKSASNNLPSRSVISH